MRISEIFHLQKVNPNGSVTVKHFSGQEQRKSATYNLSSLWLNRLVFIVGSGSDLQLMTRVSTFFVALKWMPNGLERGWNGGCTGANVRRSASATRTVRRAGEEAAAHTLSLKDWCRMQKLCLRRRLEISRNCCLLPYSSLGLRTSVVSCILETKAEVKRSSQEKFTSQHQIKRSSDPVPAKVLKSARPSRRLIRGMEAAQWRSIFSSIMSNLVMISFIPTEED